MAARPTRIRRAALPYAISPGTWKPEQMAELAYQIQEDLQFIYEQVQIKGLPKNPSTGDLLVALSPAGFSLFPIDPVPQRVLINEGVGPGGGAVPEWGQVSLSSGVKGNLPVAHLDGGINASAATVWRGDGHWGEAPLPFSARPIFMPPLDGEPGDDGLIGAPGAVGGSGIPGAPGPAGVPGPPGFGFDGQDADDPWPGLPGPSGSSGQAMGARQARSAGVIYQADTDGFFVVEYRSTTDDDLIDVSLLADTFSPPTTERGGLSINAGVIGITAETTTIPIRNGEYYEAVVNATNGAPTALLYFVAGGGQGPTGGIGPPGGTGPTGPVGPPGVGLPGLDGEDGEEGPMGFPVPGPQGAQGIQGPIGPSGGGGGGVALPYAPADEPDGGDPEYYLLGLGGGNLQTTVATVIAGGSLITSTFNPQGLVLGNIGQIVGDALNLRVWQKVAGQATKTGWYPIESPGYQAAPGMPVPWYHTLSGVQAIAGGAIRGNGYGYFASGPGDGVDAFTNSGFAATSTEIYVNGKRYGRFEPAATSGTSAYMAIGAGTPGLNPRKILDDDIDIWVDMRTDPTAVTTVRYWFGLTSANLTDTDTLGSAANGSIMFRFSTAAGDGGWVGATQLNGGANQTVTATILAIAAATNYRLRIRFVRTGTPTAYFSINDGPETAVTTNIPATGSTYFPIFGLTTKANVTRSILWRSFGASVGS